MFRPLDSSEGCTRRRVALTCGFLLEILAVGAVALVTVLFPAQLRLAKQYALVWLPPLEPQEKPAPPPRKVIIPKYKPPVIPQLAAPHVAELEAPRVERPAAPPPAPNEKTPPPAPPAFPSSAPPAPKPEIAIRTGTFGGGHEPVTTKLPLNQVQTGGFGSPEGFRGQAHGDSLGNVPKVGAFGLPDGPGQGTGTGGSHGVKGVVASAGFGSGIAGGSSGPRSTVANAGFGNGATNSGGGGARNVDPVVTGAFKKPEPVTPSQAQAAQARPEFQPVEILFKPAPVYTEEGRRLGIQGEVVLSVVFQASGAIRVVGVVKSLGHGLDQAAEQAALQIRFKPALRDTKPADFPATLRIEFRLADQS